MANKYYNAGFARNGDVNTIDQRAANNNRNAQIWMIGYAHSWGNPTPVAYRHLQDSESL